MNEKPYVYLLECANGQFYVGSTTDLERRLKEHEAGRDALSPKPIYLFDLCTQKNIPHTQKHMLANVKSMVGVELRKYVGQMENCRIGNKIRNEIRNAMC